MADRFFAPHPIASPRITLDAAQSHHLARVMRAAVGDEVTVFDGSGCEFAARVERLGRDGVELSLGPPQAVDREAARPVTLGVSLPKGERQRWLVEKCVELGVSELVPLATRRGVAQPTEAACQRLRRAVVEASKQCGRNRLMQIAPAAAWDDFLAAAGPTDVKLIADPRANQAASALVGALQPANPCRLAVGPEGGFDDAEREAARRAGWQEVNLGARVLRVETAALYLAAIAGS